MFLFGEHPASVAVMHCHCTGQTANGRFRQKIEHGGQAHAG
jgi:metal-dependent hydrolase (beta-lactamase superfamily II)